MNSVALEFLSVQSMVDLLTAPYRRGAETLAIPLGADVANGTDIIKYDFKEYRARYSADPAEPRYVLFLKKDLGHDPLEIEIDFSFQGSQQTAAFTIPPQSFAGISFAIPLKADATLRLLRFRQRPLPLLGAGADNFGILALLGNISKLLWVLSWEKDQIRQYLRDIQQQRRRELAHSISLDFLGRDLRVPRFPPREHSFDFDTIALYHLNDAIANTGTVLDETTRFGLVGHPGVNVGAQSLVIGKFGNAFRFPGINGNGGITIATHADFDLPTSRSFTVEAFINLDPIPINDQMPRVIIIKGQVDPAGTLTGAGWMLSMANFQVRGIANNVRWSVSDGVRQIEISAKFNIADGKFHHLAGILDRDSKRSRLFVDGEECENIDISALGALTNADDIHIGRSAIGHSLSGVVDEVRFSKVARTDFHPVLGEGDEFYRQRLGIFERWLLPTPDALLSTINNLVHINGEAESFVLIENDRPSVGASKLIRILPVSLPVRQSIDHDGNSLSKESDVSGLPEEDVDFNPIFLLTHNRLQVDYGANPNNHLMQSATKARLDALVDLLVAASPPIAGNLIIDKAFDETDPGLHKVGLAVLLHHQNLAFLSAAINAAATTTITITSVAVLPTTLPFKIRIDDEVMMVTVIAAVTWTVTRGVDGTVAASHALNAPVIQAFDLGVLAYQAGFDFVRNDGTHIYASVSASEKLEIIVETVLPATGIDLFTGRMINLHIAPEALPSAGQIKWTLIGCGAGRAHFEAYEQTTLSAASDAAATTITIASDTGFPNSLPFKIRIDDEVMSVTAVVATTWTVTRGIDGTIAAPHALNSLVILALRTPLTTRPHLRLAADASGEITVRVEYTFLRSVVSGTRTIRIGIDTLADQATIAANGDMKILEAEAVGSLGEIINPIYLVTSNETAVDYGADPNNKKMQIVLEKAFKILLAIQPGLATGLQVLKAFDPADPGLHKAGRALLIAHTAVAPDRLGALAHQAGFGFVRRQGTQIHCSVASGEKIEIVHADTLTPLDDELVVGAPVDIHVRSTELFSVAVGFQTELDSKVISNALKLEFSNLGITLSVDAKVSTLEPGKRWLITDQDKKFFLSKDDNEIDVFSLADNYNWSIDKIGNGRGSLDFILRPKVKFTPIEPGFLALNLTYLEEDAQSTFPYTFEIRLKPQLEAINAVIPKHQYDLIMNILNFFHPIGVEVVTGNIRKHVVEIEQDPQKAFPAYSFADFRV